METDRVRLDFAEAIKVELTDEGTEVVVLEKLRDDIGRKYVRVFDEKCFTIFRPAK